MIKLKSVPISPVVITQLGVIILNKAQKTKTSISPKTIIKI